MRSLLLPILSALMIFSSCGGPDNTKQDNSQILNQEAKVKEKVCENCDEEALNAPLPGKDPTPEEKAEEEALKNIPLPTGKPADAPAAENTIPPLPERNPLRNPPSRPKEPIKEKQGKEPANTLPPFKPGWGLNKKAYTRAKAYFEANHTAFPNQKVVTIVDMSQHSSRNRFFLFHLTDGTVEAHRTSHGEGSDIDNDGFAESFSNTPKSLKTSLGAYRTLTTYEGNHGNSLKLQGLSPTNSNALRRAVVVHGARYLNAKTGFKVGRSWGCPALAPNVAQPVIKQIKGGSLLYIAN